MKKFLLILVLGAVTGVQAQTAAEKLHALFDREWDYSMRIDPVWASILGDRRWNHLWPDLSQQAREANEKHQQDVLRELEAIDRSDLSAPDQLNRDLFHRSLRVGLERSEMFLHLMPLTHRYGIQTANEHADALRFETVRDYHDWIGRLRGFSRYMDQTIDLMREGIRRRVVHARAVMERVPRQIEAHIVDDPEQSPFYKPFRKFADGIDAADQLRLEKAAWQAIKESVVPAFGRFEKFFNEEYLPACFERAGAWQWPHGERAYDFLVRDFTTTDLTAEQVHAIGLREVKRIRAEMEAIRERVGFGGDLKAFFEHLRTDSKFYYQTGEELLTGYRALGKKVDPLMVKLFGKLPRMPYGIEAIPALMAPDTTTAYYRWPAPDGSRAGTYFVNLYKPETRPKWEMVALSLHEAVPGHHLQIALAQEQRDLPKFRRHLSVTAYIEGWGLYAESLGDELGLYEDPYDKFGQLTYEMWRAVRLVVDTGIHAKQWSRERAIDYFMANAPKTRQDVVNEVDRYIAWPGQALAYKIGQLKIRELRERAEKRLGDKFDVRSFHDMILESGAVPLEILERRVESWINGR